MSHVREGLGYELRYYDPCFNYNADRFCCSKRGQKFRENVLLSDCPLNQKTTYNMPRNFSDAADQARPLWLKQSGLVDPPSYEFTPKERQYVWCNRLPYPQLSGQWPRGAPCQNTRPEYHNPGSCAANGSCSN